MNSFAQAGTCETNFLLIPKFTAHDRSGLLWHVLIKVIVRLESTEVMDPGLVLTVIASYPTLCYSNQVGAVGTAVCSSDITNPTLS